MTERTKLTRGLADISPLFLKEKNLSRVRAQIIKPDLDLPVASPSSRMELFFVWSVDDETDSHFLNSFLASKLTSVVDPAILLCFEKNSEKKSPERTESSNQSLQRICLPATKIEEALVYEGWEATSYRAKAGLNVFLDMGMESLLDQPQLVPLLSHIVLFVRPNVDSVTEVYRRLRHFVALGLQAEISILFDAADSGGLPARLFELFSDFVSRKLSLSINYLGTLHLSRSAHGLEQDIRWDNLNLSRIARSETIEKLRFFKWVEQLQRQAVSI